MLADSLRKYGAGRSILLDRNGRIIAGNKTTEGAAEAGLEDVLIVESDGTKLIAVKRTDLDLLEGDSARELAYIDNRAAELAEWDTGQLLEDLNAGLDFSGL